MSGHVQYSSLSAAEQDNRNDADRASASGSQASAQDSEGRSSPVGGSQASAQDSERASSPDPPPSTVHATKSTEPIMPLLKPTLILLLGALLALGHHLFNAYADRKSIDLLPVSQVWMSRVGTAFAFGFRTALATSLSFVTCQLMWLSLRRKFMTFSEIDNVYLVANKDGMATFFSLTILNSPLLVITAALSFLLPISTVLAPSSLRVIPHTITDLSVPCQVPTGNLTNGGDGSKLYLAGGYSDWTGSTPLAQKLATSTLVGQEILSLPQACGLNCSYSVSLPSFAFLCQEGVELPAGMEGSYNRSNGDEPFWNATTSGTGPITPFYVFWKSSTQSGTNGTALCTVEAAQYDFAVQTTNGQQIVTYNVNLTGDLHNTAGLNDPSMPIGEWIYALQLYSIAAATRSLLLGTTSILHDPLGWTPKFNSSATSAAFFDTSSNSGIEYTWGNVARGIEQLSHNISAAILTMDLGTQDSSCAVTRQDIVYAYDRLNLWLPYGIALLVIALCLVLGVFVFLRLNLENLTSSFSDTVGITRNPSLDAFALGAGGLTDSKRKTRLIRFRLGELKGGGTGFGVREDLKIE